MQYNCRICGKTFEGIPPDWVRIAEVGKRGGWQMWQAADGLAHDVRKTQPVNSRKMHQRWHKTPKEGCEFCLERAQPPVEVAVQQQEEIVAVQQQEEIVVVQQQEVSPQEVRQEEIKSGTAMQQAFRRMKYGT